MTATRCVPATLVAGDSWSWTDDAAALSHPPPDWALAYLLRPLSGGGAITIGALWLGDSYTLSLTAASSAAVAPGEYTWSAVATNDATDARATLAQGRLTVLPNPATSSADARSQAERILAAIEATIEGRATKDADSYSIEGRSISRTPMADLLRLRGLYRREVAAERAPGSGGIGYRRMKM